jgi:hypothetical protein
VLNIMKKFVMVYKVSASAGEAMKNADPEEKKKGMEKWMEWQKKMGDSLVEMGTPLGKGEIVTSSGSSEASKEIVGYSVLQAESMEDAKKLVAENPHVSMAEGFSIEVYEAMPMPK